MQQIQCSRRNDDKTADAGQARGFAHIRRHDWASMSTLANHAFTKMNGLGNEIVVVDMRGEKIAITAAEARAAAQPSGAPFDQLMALHAPRTPGTDGYVR